MGDFLVFLADGYNSPVKHPRYLSSLLLYFAYDFVAVSLLIFLILLLIISCLSESFCCCLSV